MEKLTLYHGSDHKIGKPIYQGGKRTNDYGFGFYCTKDFELACEWAAKSQDKNAYTNQYSIDTKNLKVLDLTDKKYTILNWVAILLENRTFTLNAPISIEAKDYITKHFHVNTDEFDIIRGYRADDSYFSFAEDFLNNTISLQQLEKAMKLGDLGIQYVFVSQKAFEEVKFETAILIDKEKYSTKFKQRDFQARKKYKCMKVDLSVNSNELYVRDIIKGGFRNGDPRL